MSNPKIMTLTLLVLPFLLAGCAQTPSPPTPLGTPASQEKVAIDILGEVGWVPNHVKEEQLVFQTQKQMMDAWLADGGSDKSPPMWIPKNATRGLADAKPIDFDRQIVIAVFRGQATDHDGIQIERLVKQGEKVVVEYRNVPVNKGTAPMPAYPSHVVVVSKTESKVEFNALPPVQQSPVPVP